MPDSFLGSIQQAMEPIVRQFGLHSVEESEDSMYCEVRFANETTGLRVAIDWSEFKPAVALSRLENGQFPPEAAAALQAGKPIQDFDFDDLLILRSKSPDSVVGKMFSDRSPDGVLPLLRRYATAIAEHASDVLSGDFDVFRTLDGIVRKRFAAAQGRRK